MGLRQFNAAFIYRADRIDGWRVLSQDDPRGDCDDYALTVAHIVAGSRAKFWRMVMRRQIQFWFCRDPNGAKHLQLFIKGHGWTDNWFQDWRDGPQHRNRFRCILPLIALKVLIGKVTR